MTRISVVIPTLDRPSPLAACLSTLAVGFPPDAETIVVSDGGTCDLRPVVAPFVDRLRLRLLTVANGGPAAARNRGLEIARGEIVVFTDDDCRPQRGWVTTLASGVTLSPPRAVGGTTNNGLPDNPYADAAQLILNLLSRYDRARTGRERFVPSNNLACPVETLRRLGGFDERFRTAEDRELCRRWAAAGFALGRVPDAVVEHDSRMDFASFIRKFTAYGRGAGQFHASGGNPSLRESAAFHVRLPILLAPELRRRGFMRGAAIVALLVVWEAANVVGFLGPWIRRPATAAAAVAASLEGER